VFVDPFHSGRIVLRADLDALLRRLTTNRVRLHEAHLRPATRRSILTRMLQNLKSIYYRRGDFERTLMAVERIVILNPAARDELRDRGLLYGLTGHREAAIADLEDYLDRWPDAPDALKILFVCYANSIRSQMAEGYARARLPEGGQFEVASAGVQSAEVHPFAIRAMAEIGVDISLHRSKSLGSLRGERFDVVVSLSDHARRLCDDFFPKARRLHWPILDPMGIRGEPWELAEMFALTRDDIALRVDELLVELAAPVPLRPRPSASR
jgi:arsenate reductase